MNFSTVAFSVEEIAAVAQAYVTFQTLVQKIQLAAPDAWAAVQADFDAAAAAWKGPTVQQLVERSGQLPGMPTGLTDAESASQPPEQASPVPSAPAIYDETDHVQDVTPLA